MNHAFFIVFYYHSCVYEQCNFALNNISRTSKKEYKERNLKIKNYHNFPMNKVDYSITFYRLVYISSSTFIFILGSCLFLYKYYQIICVQKSTYFSDPLISFTILSPPVILPSIFTFVFFCLYYLFLVVFLMYMQILIGLPLMLT